MSKDPAFLFYPGDYLRDTQCLSSNSQVAYDRIMCEHMRNICISQQQLNFFTKRLTEDEQEELLMVLNKIDGGYQITWIAESISKRKAYSESRRKNRASKPKKDMINISKTYDEHMENENENENVIKVRKGKGKEIPLFEEFKEYALSNAQNIDHEKLKQKYEAWKENGWKNGNDKPIKNWKSTLANTLQYLKSDGKQKSNVVNDNDRQAYINQFK